MKSNGVKIEDLYNPSDSAVREIADMYANFYKFRSERQKSYRQIQYLNLEEYWTQSRNLFWNSTVTQSEDLEALGLAFSLPFVRKEVMDFTGNLVSMNMSPKLSGDDLNLYAVNVLQAMHKKWRLKSKDRVEKFWQILYGTMNGTTCSYVGYNMNESNLKYITEYAKSDDYKLDKKTMRKWDDAFTEIVPLEEIYFQKIWERNVQKQGKTIRVKEMLMKDFKKEFPVSRYPMAEFVQPGSMIADDSLFHKLLGGSGILATDKVQVLYEFDTDEDEYKILGNGIWVNALGKKNDECAPNHFAHKSQPYVVSQHEAIDEKFIYGLSMPFKIKDMSKILNTSYTMMVERELRAIDPPIISSDFEAPQLIFGQNRVVPVNDINAYKEFSISEASGAYMNMMNSMQGMMSTFSQGGFSQIAPSIQPRSARELSQIDMLKQKALGNTLVMYYDMLHQETFLLLKTMLQYYPVRNFSSEKNLVRAFTVPNFSLSRGGVGNLEVRFVQKPSEGLALYFEAVHKSIEQGKTTEIIEVPIDMIQNLEFFIDDIKLESEKSDDMERAAFNEQVLQPLLNVFIPAGVADINKTYLRFLEKMGEHPTSFTSEQNMPQIMAAWGGAPMPPQMQGAMGRQDSPAMQGNMNQSVTGMRFGGQSNPGLPQQ